MMAKLSDLVAALQGRVDTETSLVASLLKLFAVQHEQLEQIISEENPAMIINGVRAMMDTLKNSGDQMAAIILANTPADPNAQPGGTAAGGAPAAQPGTDGAGSQGTTAASATGQSDANTGAAPADPNAGKSTARSK